MLIEREEPLDRLWQLATGLRSGHGSVALVTGEAGIGKTALLEALRARANGEFDVAWGGCEALFTPRPLGPVHDMASVLGPEVDALLQDGTDPAAIFNAILTALEQHATPLVLIVEDVHWADRTTLDFLKFLGRRIALVRTLLILSFRDDELDPQPQLDQLIGDLPQSRVHRVPLAPLSREGIARIDHAEQIDIDRVFEITSGNPFFVTEVIAAYESGDDEVPASVKDSVNARLGRLCVEERRFLEAMSVVPGVFDPMMIKKMFGPAGETLAMACLGRRLLVDHKRGTLRFRHELARLATMSRLSAMQVQAIHAQVLECLLDPEVDAGSLARLVHHAAGALDGARVLELAPKAARAAAALGSHREAAAHYRTALRFADEAEPELAAELYEGWAYEAGIALQIDDEVIEARRHAVTLWRALKRPDKIGDNLRWLSRLHWYRGEADKANRYANEAVKVLEAGEPSAERAMAYSFRAQLHMLNDRLALAIEWGTRALALAEQAGHVESKIHALNNIGTARAYLDQDTGIGLLEQSLALALEHGFHEHAARVYTNLACYAVDFRRFGLADRIINEGIAFDSEHELDAWTHYLVGVLAQLRLEQGRLADAEKIARGVLKIDRLTLLMKLPARSVLARVAVRRGTPDAFEQLNAVLVEARATDEMQYIVPLRLALVEYWWLRDAPARAHEQFQAFADLDGVALNPWQRGEIHLWAARVGFDMPAFDAASLPEPIAEALSGDGARAAESWLTLGAPYMAGLAWMAVAAEDPRQHLSSAIRVLETMGASNAAGKARRLAKDHGVEKHMPRKKRGPYGVARTHPLGLSKREQEVLVLVLDGAHNQQIADQLCRSRRTVENHVSSVFSKLNVESRMGAMMRVRNEPWILE